VYPNPVDKQLNIQLPETIIIDNVIITNILGQNINLQSEQVVLANTITIRTDNLSEGIYFIQLNNIYHSYHLRVLVRH
jgi:hypothetical protein